MWIKAVLPLQRLSKSDWADLHQNTRGLSRALEICWICDEMSRCSLVSLQSGEEAIINFCDN